MRLLIILSLVLIINACKPLLIEDKNSYTQIIADAWIELNEPLTVRMEEGRIFMQSGQIIDQAELDLYTVNCELEMQKLSDTKRIIQPDRFDIKGTSQQSSPIVMARPYQLASLQMIASSPADIKRVWVFLLYSEKQPEVRALICRGPQNSEESAKLPTIDEMQNTLGELITLHLTSE